MHINVYCQVIYCYKFVTDGRVGEKLVTDFGKTVKKKLIDMDKRQKWLIEEVRERTGMFLDMSYLQKVMRGERHPQKIIDAICEILDIEDGGNG